LISPCTWMRPAEVDPVSALVALQIGGRASREFSRIRGLSGMLQPIFGQPNAQVALVEFDSKVNLIQDFTHDDRLVEEELNHLESGDGSAAILDAIEYSVKLLEGVPKGRQRVLLLVSETRDHGSQQVKIDDMVTEVGNSNTVVYALPFSPALSQVLDTARGSNRDEWKPMPDLVVPLAMTLAAMRKNIPRTIASVTGGEYELFSSLKSFETKMTLSNRNLRTRFSPTASFAKIACLFTLNCLRRGATAYNHLGAAAPAVTLGLLGACHK